MSSRQVCSILLGGRSLLTWSALRACALPGQGLGVSGQRRELSHVPVDDLIGGLTEEQVQVLAWEAAGSRGEQEREGGRLLVLRFGFPPCCEH